MHNMQGEKFLLFAFSKVSGSKYCLSFNFTPEILQSFFMDTYLIKSINSSLPMKITFWAVPLHYVFYSDFFFSDSLNALMFSDFFSSLCVSFAISFLNMVRHAFAPI